MVGIPHSLVGSCLLVRFLAIQVICSVLSMETILDNVKNMIDMSYRFKENETIFWPGAPKYIIEKTQENRFEESEAYFFTSKEFSAAEHGGTHMDAPIHFAEGQQNANQVPVENLIGPGVRVDVREKTDADPLALVTIEDIKSWEKEYGTIPDKAIVLFYTGRGKYWPDERKYFGKVDSRLNFPGLDPYAAAWLTKKRKIVGVGIDTASIDTGISTTYGAHVALAKAGIYILENVANMDQLPGPTGFTIVALPMKIYEGTGAPVRIVALIGDSTTSSACRPSMSLFYFTFVIVLFKIIRLVQ